MLSPHPRSALPLATSAQVSPVTSVAVVRFSLLLWGAAAGMACGKVTDTVAIDDSLSASAGSSAEGGSGGGLPPGAECGDSYPQLVWPTGTGRTVCTPSFARERMSQALCTCGDVSTFAGVRTDAFDSATQATIPGAAAVGINGVYESPAPTLLSGGSVTIAASAPLTSPLLDVRGDLRLAGALEALGPLTVTGDAWFAESVKAVSIMTITGDVHQVPGKTLEATVPLAVGQLLSEEFSIAPPCRCDEDQILDIASVIESAAQENDNTSIGLNATDLMQPADAVTLTLACGRYYLNGIESAQEIHLRVVGRVALFVAGDVSSTGPLRMKLDPSAELDWFIGGKLTLPGRDRDEDAPPALELGDAARPAATRIYVGGDGPLSVPQEQAFANLYAPRANINLEGKSPLSGSVFGHTVASLRDIAVHYDVAVQRVADGCALDEPATCSGCGQCSAGRACVAGSCAACTADADCCWPLVCDEGGRCAAFQE